MTLDGFKYEIIISSNASEKLISKIVQYWSYKNGVFEDYLENLDLNSHLSMDNITAILENSKCLITFRNCLLCHDSLTVTGNDREDFLKWVKLNPRICSSCKEFSPNYCDEISFEKPLDTSVRELSNEELKVLTGIVRLNNKALIYRHIFNNDISDSSIWKIVNRLQRKGLIWIDRDTSWKIMSFNFSSELQNIIK